MSCENGDFTHRITIADRIRAMIATMTDEELALLIHCVQANTEAKVADTRSVDDDEL